MGLVTSHVGQFFFDQSLQAEVEAFEPYSRNAQPLTKNTEDMVLAAEADTSDPMMEYVLLGKSVTDGILGWISIGIDPTEARNVYATSTYYESGGVQGSLVHIVPLVLLCFLAARMVRI
jgi:hypothetical protein